MATWIVGDVHGCAGELEDLLARVALSTGDRLILVGDLFDKGPDPAGVLHLSDETAALAVLGNHDVLVRDHGRDRLQGRPARRTGYVAECLDRLAAAGELERAVELCGRLPLTLSAGPDLTVVHGGLHPERGIAGTDERLATTLREWPRGEPGARKWWQQWEGPGAVVFGHDARQGLVERRDATGRPVCIGLDTGCVYGGVLTAWCPEQDRLASVPARRAWHPRS